MNVLVACECSGAVRDEFRARGHDAWSCDLKIDDAMSPFHIYGDAVAAMSESYLVECDGVRFISIDIFRNGDNTDARHPTTGKWGVYPTDDVRRVEWDLMVAHPPCTNLTVSGARWMDGKRNKNQHTFFQVDYVQDGIDFFMKFVNSKIPKVAIENPIGIMSSEYRAPDQIVNPWQFGEPFQKATCLWLKGLPKLVPTKIVDKGETVTFSSGKRMAKWLNDAKVGSKAKTSEVRSRTFKGIAMAMAEQWGIE